MAMRRLGMIVPSLNTVAEDDFRAYCPSDVGYHVHRVRLRREPGRVTVADLARTYDEAIDAARLLKDFGADAVVFNCTGASVAPGERSDVELAEAMTRALGIPSTNTMVAIKRALDRLKATTIIHVCPFADDSAGIERRALLAAGLVLDQSVGLNFTDAREAARMEPERIAEVVRGLISTRSEAILLSCANVRAFEAVDGLEREFGIPVVTSNQAVLWDTLWLAGWQGELANAGRLFRAA